MPSHETCWSTSRASATAPGPPARPARLLRDDDDPRDRAITSDVASIVPSARAPGLTAKPMRRTESTCCSRRVGAIGTSGGGTLSAICASATSASAQSRTCAGEGIQLMKAVERWNVTLSAPGRRTSCRRANGSVEPQEPREERRDARLGEEAAHPRFLLAVDVEPVEGGDGEADRLLAGQAREELRVARAGRDAEPGPDGHVGLEGEARAAREEALEAATAVRPVVAAVLDGVREAGEAEGRRTSRRTARCASASRSTRGSPAGPSGRRPRSRSAGRSSFGSEPGVRLHPPEREQDEPDEDREDVDRDDPADEAAADVRHRDGLDDSTHHGLHETATCKRGGRSAKEQFYAAAGTALPPFGSRYDVRP